MYPTCRVTNLAYCSNNCNNIMFINPSNILFLMESQNGNVNVPTANTSSNQVSIHSRQLKPGLLPMVPELAKQFGRNLNPLVSPAVQVKEVEEAEVPTPPGMLNRAPGTPVGNLVPNAVPKVPATPEGLNIAYCPKVLLSLPESVNNAFDETSGAPTGTVYTYVVV